jgi:hypothetical protein
MKHVIPIKKMVKAQIKAILSFLVSISGAVAAFPTEHQPSRTPTVFMAPRNDI